MAFYQDVKPHKMSKQEHLRKDWNEGEEGSRYRGSNGRPSGDNRRNDNRGGYQGKNSSFEKGGYQGRSSSFERNGQNRGNSFDRNGSQGRGNSFDKGGYQSKGNSFNQPSYQSKGAPYGGKSTGYQSRSGAPMNGNRRPDEHRTVNHAPATGNPFAKQPVKPAVRPAQPKPAPRAEVRPAPVQPQFDTPYTKEPENLLSGRNPIREAIKAGHDIEKLLVAKGDLSGSAREIVAMARERRIPVQVVERARLDEITRNHQGMLAFASAYHYSDVESILAEAHRRNEPPFIIILDGVTDPHNLGAVIRTAACVGAHGVIVPERRAVGLTPAAVKASAGAVETIKVARVGNLVRTIDILKKEGLWIYAADMIGEDYRTLKMEAPMALVIGSEGDGISRLVLEKADYRVKLPMYGGVESLNASVAAGILMYAVVHGRE